MPNLFLAVSIVFLLLGICGYTWKGGDPKTRIWQLGLSALLWANFAFILLYFVANSFTGEGFTGAITYHLQYGLEGTNFKNFIPLISFGVIYLLVTLGISIWIVRRKKVETLIKIGLFIVCFLLALIFNPTTHYITSLIGNNLTKTHASPIDPNSDFYNYYKEPELIKIGPQKNLVYLYIESLEGTYFNQESFPGLTPNLTKLKESSINFTNLYQPAGAGFTIGGITASQCGIPPISPSKNNQMDGMDSYLGSARCLGDVLAEKGYYLAYYGGSNLDFGGKKKFFETHEFDEASGLNELQEKTQNFNYKHGWGLYDDTLLDLFYTKFLELGQKQEPFIFFGQTTDTHPPGFLSHTCREKNIIYVEGKDTMMNAVKCVDFLVSELVKKIRASKYGKNTVIVLASDHLSMKSSTSSLLRKHTRKPFFLINLPKQTSIENKNKGSSLDFSSTLLPFIGFRGDIGLGTDLLSQSENGANTRQTFIQKNLHKWNDELMSFWGFPNIKEGITFKTEEGFIFINGIRLKIPLMMTVEDDSLVKPNFSFHPFRHNKQFFKKNSNSPYLFIDSCYNTNLMVYKQNRLKTSLEDYCILSQHNHKKINSGANLSEKEIIQFVRLDTPDSVVSSIIIPTEFSSQILTIKDEEAKQYNSLIEHLDKGIEKNFTSFSIPLSLVKNNVSCNHSLCEIEKLFSWIKAPKNKGISIIIQDIQLLRHIAEHYSDLVPHIIPEIEDPSIYQELKEDLQYGKIIWKTDSFIEALEKNEIAYSSGFQILDLMAGSLAVAISPENLKPELRKIFQDKKVPFYTFARTLSHAQKLKRKFKAEHFYVDTLEF